MAPHLAWRGCWPIKGFATKRQRERERWWTRAARIAWPDAFAACSSMECGAVRESRAIVFDLDDTLYPYRAFVLSGFGAVARRLAHERGLPVRTVLRVLRRAFASSERGREVQAVCAKFSLPASMLPWLVAVMRDHPPSLHLRGSVHQC